MNPQRAGWRRDRRKGVEPYRHPVHTANEPNDAETIAVEVGQAVRESRPIRRWSSSRPRLRSENGATSTARVSEPAVPRKPETAARLALGEAVDLYGPPGKKEDALVGDRFPARRVPLRMAWGNRCELLYWAVALSGVEDPDPKTLDRRKTPRAVALQRRRKPVYPGRAVGYDGIASSLRLKALRDSIEDYEYLAILDRQGKTDAARKIVLAVTESFFQWNPDPKAYQEARAKLAQLIVAGEKK